MRVVMRALYFDVDAHEIQSLMRQYGLEGGKIDYQKFLEIMTNKINDVDPVEEIAKAFDIFVKDKRDSGEKRITSRDLQIISKEMCDGYSMKEIDAMITEFYPNRDPEKEGINYEEFFELMEGVLPQK